MRPIGSVGKNGNPLLVIPVLMEEIKDSIQKKKRKKLFKLDTLQPMNKPVLICLMGLPRSGKTTIVRKLMRKHHAPIVRRDDIRLALHGQRYCKAAEPFVKAISDIMIRSLFLSGHEIVICDETNFSRATRDYHKSPNWRTVFYEVLTPPEVCIQRAHATNQPDLEIVIKQMWARLQPLDKGEERYEEWLTNL